MAGFVVGPAINLAVPLVEKLIAKWRHGGPEVRNGTACKCGAHTSAAFDNGGSAWLAAHAVDAHSTGEEKTLAVVMALPLKPPLTVGQKKAITEAILGGIGTETLGNA